MTNMDRRQAMGLIALGLVGTSATLAAGKPKRLSLKEAAKVLGYDPESHPKLLEVSLKEVQGYWMNSGDFTTVNLLAGVYAGTVSVTRQGNVLTYKGNYSELSQPAALARVLDEADVDRNSVITSKEVVALETKILKEKLRLGQVKDTEKKKEKPYNLHEGLIWFSKRGN